VSKNIVICCDGTGNQFSKSNTNIVEIYRLVENNTERQIAYYDPGVGTMTDKARGYAFGYGLQDNIEDAYRYLMNNYRTDDKIFLFGFSRGAFTVRCLAGMINKCGLLFRGSDNMIQYSSQMYNTRNNDDLAQGFKKTFAQDVPIYFIGVFDTVASLGWVYGRKNYFDDSLNHDISYGYHALAIDEKRSKFYPSLWDESRKSANQTIEQVWFAGVHSDIGGSYEDNRSAKITLKWMLEKAIACENKLLIDDVEFAKISCDSSAPLHDSFTWKWWALGEKVRKIPENSLIHKSVFERKANPDNKYNPSNLPKTYREVE